MSALASISHDDELIDITKTDWFREMEANHHPGITIRVYRGDRGWTLAELAEKTGIAESHLSAIENRKRGGEGDRDAPGQGVRDGLPEVFVVPGYSPSATSVACQSSSSTIRSRIGRDSNSSLRSPARSFELNESSNRSNSFFL